MAADPRIAASLGPQNPPAPAKEMDIPAMRLVTATLIVDRTNLHPTERFQTTFNQDGVGFVLLITRTGKGITAGLVAPGDSEPLETTLDPEATPTEQQQRLAEWIVFVVDMTLVIRQLTNA